MSNRLRLAVAIPAYGGQITAHQARMWAEFGSTVGGSAERFALISFGFEDINGIDRARNTMLDKAARVGADWLLMIDADTWVESGEPDTDAGFLLLRMLSDADRIGATVVVAPVVKRSTSESAKSVMLYDNTGQMIDLDSLPRGLSEVEAAATAVFAVNVAKTKGLEFAFTETLSEDREFCRQVRAQGGKIYVDTRVRTGHMSRQCPLFSA